MDFKTFLSAYFHYDFLFDQNDNKLVDYIGRVETLQDDFDQISTRLEISKQNLLHKTASRHDDYRRYYDEESKHFVAMAYCKDIKTFGYEF